MNRKISPLEGLALEKRWENRDPTLTLNERVFVMEKRLRLLERINMLALNEEYERLNSITNDRQETKWGDFWE